MLSPIFLVGKLFVCFQVRIVRSVDFGLHLNQILVHVSQNRLHLVKILAKHNRRPGPLEYVDGHIVPFDGETVAKINHLVPNAMNLFSYNVFPTNKTQKLCLCEYRFDEGVTGPQPS